MPKPMDTIDPDELEQLIKELDDAMHNIDDTVNALEGALSFIRHHHSRAGRADTTSASIERSP